VNLDSLRNQIASESAKRCERASKKLTDQLKRTAPVGETGNTKRNTGARVTTQSRTRIVTIAEIDTETAIFVVEDTRPHEIRPRNKKALSFNWPKRGGVVVFAKVSHPGTQGNQFFQNAIDRWSEYLSAS
jgi:hypothetical protein